MSDVVKGERVRVATTGLRIALDGSVEHGPIEYYGLVIEVYDGRARILAESDSPEIERVLPGESFSFRLGEDWYRMAGPITVVDVEACHVGSWTKVWADRG